MRVICSYIKPLAVGCKEKVRVEFGHLEELLQNGTRSKGSGSLSDIFYLHLHFVHNRGLQNEQELKISCKVYWIWEKSLRDWQNINCKE